MNFRNMKFPTPAAIAKQLLDFNPKRAWHNATRPYTLEERIQMGAILIHPRKDKVKPVKRQQPAEENKPETVPPPAAPKVDPRMVQSLEGYTKLAVIGQGAQGVVLKCEEHATGCIVAVKESAYMSPKQFDEFDLQERMKGSSRVVQVHAADTCGDSFERPRFFIVMELVEGGELTDVLGSPDWDESVLAYTVKGALLGLQDVHDQNMVFIDLKPQNVLATTKGELKLADFGLVLDLEDPNSRFRGGTPEYCAPEALTSSSIRITPAFDVWSVGMMAIGMHEGMPAAFDGIDDPYELIRLVHDSAPPQLQTACEDGLLSDFVKQALVKDPAGRATIPELLAHPFLAKACTPEHFAGLVQSRM
jgi:serine/threonine protein kinase